MSIEALKGTTLKSVVEGCDEITFTTVDDRVFRMYHSQDCCESVVIDEIHGDLEDLVGSEIVQAEEVSNEEEPPVPEYTDSYTWTFYKLATIKGYVTIRWFGSSNGYYSESVDVVEISRR